MNNNNIIFVVIAICVAAIGGFIMLTSGDVTKTAATTVPAPMDEQFRQFILDNPEVLEESLNNLSSKRKEFAESKRANYLDENYDEIIENTKAPKAGSKDAKHHVIEFFDYNCGWCKKMILLECSTWNIRAVLI